MAEALTQYDHKIVFESNISKQLFSKKCHALLGISPFNSYFTETNITKLLSWAKQNFTSFDVFLPSGLSKFTLLGLGYDEQRAQKKTSRQDQYLYNKVIRSYNNIGLSTDQAISRIITTDKLLAEPAYSTYLNFYKNLCQTDQFFQNLCIKASQHAMLSYRHDCSNNELKVNFATQYILHEIPLFLNTPDILNIDSSLFIYHQIPDFINELYKNYLHLKSKQQGFVGAYVENQVECTN